MYINELIGSEYTATGSSVMCNPPVLDTDVDYVAIWSLDIDTRLREAGFIGSDEVDSEKYPNSSVVICFRKDQYNIILVDDDAAYSRWKAATSLCTEMNVQDKTARVALFQYITEGGLRNGNAYNPDYGCSCKHIK